MHAMAGLVLAIQLREKSSSKVSSCFPNEVLTIVNNQNREYPMLVVLEEDNVNEYKSFFLIVLDYPQILGQGETKKYSLQQGTRLMHVGFR